MQSDQQPYRPEEAFERLKHILLKDKQQIDKLVSAMSMLHVTPRDPVWITVLVGIDLIEAVRRSGEEASSIVTQAIANAGTNIERSTEASHESARAMQSTISEVRTARSELRSFVKSLETSAGEVGERTAKLIGERIIASYDDTLKQLSEQRDMATTQLYKANKNKVLLFLVIAILVGFAIGLILGHTLQCALRP